MQDEQRIDAALQTVDPDKRGALRKIIAGAAFAVPTIASFAVSDLAVAQVGSGVTLTTVTTTTGGVTTVVTTVTKITTVATTTTTTTLADDI
jgi:hypothetical protein